MPEPGKGSTVVLFDVYGGHKEIVDVPQALHNGIKKKIEEARLVIRKDVLDVWTSVIGGSCTSFFMLEESHVRTETWPEREMHANGEVQICNYTRDNSQLALTLTLEILHLLGATSGWISIFYRGPDHPMQTHGPYSLGEFAALVHEA